MVVHPLFSNVSEKHDLRLHHSFSMYMTNDENAPLGDYTGPLGGTHCFTGIRFVQPHG